jgi:alpha-ketoglutarate-dependent 2,4-dichlorophenoxyacetate dioxygenase
MQFQSLHKVIGAEVSGIDLRQALDPDSVQVIEQAMAKFAVLVFRDQDIDEHQHASFTRNFGPIDAGLTLANAMPKRLKNPDVIDLANVDADGNIYAAGHVRNVSLLANQMWHSDSSFKAPKARYSALCGIDVPADGGETEFADQRAAYDALSAAMKTDIEGLVAEHWAFHSRNMLGGGGYSQAGIDKLPPVQWPMVQVVPESQRKTLFVGIHTREIVGKPTAEARMLLMDLLEHATQREFVYRHTWRNHDVVMWDNRCTLHRGRRYDLSAKRELRRCTTEDLICPMSVCNLKPG